MADIDRNTFARGLTGAFGKRRVAHQTHAGKTIITSEPILNENRESIESLAAHQAAIIEATTYAHFARTHEAYLQRELETGTAAYYLAVSDWFHAPRVLQIDVDRWTGKPGETIRVKARDDVRVARVAVIIRDVDGNVLEMGEAAQAEAGGSWWRYTTRSHIPLTPFPAVQAIAQDLPGNSASLTIS